MKEENGGERGVQPLNMVDKSTSPLQTHFRPVFCDGQAFSSRSKAPSKFFNWHLHPSPRDMAQQPHLASVALKRKLRQ